MQPYKRVEQSKKKIIINNFIGGIAWAMGATIGIAIVFTVLGYMLMYANVIPVVGTFISDILSYVLQNNPNLIK